ncbi:Glycosyltransferase involved in cell wall bisynthesis [Shimia gijangensis]|uniref:Glycosyltransferase involved in cell wall bisynthesis n=1 Tax=Shimia gijangensis TaxID=1470563 RepID=A0A1M6TWA3_9RHOB|nr:glycosyltransferase family 2 protein [Shimia gijangensis]SHK61302.1 Glycosyltransferase involved in cell wall bisynthesis [Shimia gijangensis]
MKPEPLLSIIIPAYQEAMGLVEAVNTIRSHADALCAVEYIVVDDGSTDATWQVIENLTATQPSVRGVRLSRNFGKEAAITAGLKTANGDVVVSIDADLQHPPELIPEMFKLWKSGAKVVNTVKQTRENEGLIKAGLTRCYFKLFHWLAGIDIGNAADFKLLDREVVDCLIALPERERFYRGLVAWVGFEQKTVLFDVAPRKVGNSNWSSTKLLRLALDSIVSFSTTPMHLMTFLGAGFGLMALFLSVRTFSLWLTANAVPGFTTVILLLIIVGSILMTGLGIIGIYVAKIYDEVKRRPDFIVREQTQFRQGLPDNDRNQTAQSEPDPQSVPSPTQEVVR